VRVAADRERAHIGTARKLSGVNATSVTAPAADTGQTPSRPVIGVLALQGDVREHVAALASCGAEPMLVRRESELAAVDALVLPGGESTAISKLLAAFELLEPLRARLRDGLPAFGSCAGMILLASEVLDTRPDAEHLSGIDMTVRRNAFGRQVDSFEADLEMVGIGQGPLHAVFIRAPWIEQVGDEVEVLAEVDGHPVAVRQDNVLAVAFHPELTDERRLHRWLLDSVGVAA
jgi:pyridoxal 5'-phosphate synthase pdxT subunit